MRAGAIGALVAWVLLTPAMTAATTTRAQCAAACADLIAQCGTTCGAFADMNAGCRRGIIRRCRREGIGFCTASAASSTSTTTTITPTTTAAHPTTTKTPATTTTSTIPNGTCAVPRPLAIGTVTGGDTSNGSDHGPGVGCMQSAEAPDLVYAVTPNADGTLTLSITSEWDAGLYVRTTCDDPQTELVCVDQLGNDATEVLQVGVTAGVTYYVFVDGYTTDSYGAYQLESQLE